jgi:hypothetical protein
MRRYLACQPLRKFSRMAMATGESLKMKMFAPRTQAMRFAFPFSGRPPLETEHQTLTI